MDDNRLADAKYRAAGAGLQIRHQVELLEKAWLLKVGTTFPGVSREALWAVASWCGLSREQAGEMDAGEIYDIAIERLAIIPDPDPATSYAPADIAKALGTSTRTINTYARAANVRTPARGQRGYRYRHADYMAICRWVIQHVSDSTIVKRARNVLKDGK